MSQPGNTLGMEAWRLSALAESSRLTEEEKNSYKALTVVDDYGDFKMSDATMEKALLILTVLLEKHYGKKAVLLIDEYDVQLAKANELGYTSMTDNANNPDYWWDRVWNSRDAGLQIYYKRTVDVNCVFSDKMYLFPIPQGDINKNLNLVQNYGW